MLAYLVIIVITCGLFLFHYFTNRTDFQKKFMKIPGAPLLPIIGNVHQFGTSNKDILKTLTKFWNDCDMGTYRLKLGPHYYVVISTPECIEVVLKNNSQLDKTEDYKFLSPLFGNGLIASTGDSWKVKRKLITPCFHFKILDNFLEAFNTYGETFAKVLEKREGQIFDVHPLIAAFTLDTICDTAMGLKVNVQEDPTSDFAHTIEELCKIITSRIFSSITRLDWIYALTSNARLEDKLRAKVDNFSLEIIRHKRNELQFKKDFNAKDAKTFLEVLLLQKTTAGTPLNDEEIKDEVKTFIFGGHHSTATTLSFVFYVIATHPKIQEQLFAEQKMIFGENLHRRATTQDINEMEYLEKVIYETMRLYPSFPIFARAMTDEVHLPDGHIIPKGAGAVMFGFGLGRNPKYYPDPERIIPERFDKNVQNESPFAFIPFSAGSRNCIGKKYAMLEMKSLLSIVLRQYELISPGPGYDLELALYLVMTSDNGTNIKISKRK